MMVTFARWTSNFHGVLQAQDQGKNDDFGVLAEKCGQKVGSDVEE